ncbi:OLC1v1016061C2 [Oldenlandia corymbosa var. corymbosa]|uniref:OLC1v1016061C2 n=1 Tax=Oldenlandia corymbosa var. corymbosa TaxID=529605 RepID=A0AAV1E785_OLDCO|nr:OLC1v1016061C2 [Oldenlandia corymbosa var. corymbosa]
MAGRGGVKKGVWDGNAPPECQPNPSILRLSATTSGRKRKSHYIRTLMWENLLGLVQVCRLQIRCCARTRISGLVPCAIGGTQISQWERGTENYNRLIDRTRFAMTSGGFIRAILWYQGESDTDDDAEATSYKQKLENFFLDVRADLVAIISGNNTKDINIIRQIQLETRIPNVRCVDPKGLPLKGDNLHLTTPSQVRLGQTLANTFLKFPHPGSRKVP